MLSDATQCRVGPGERRGKEGAAGLNSHGRRDAMRDLGDECRPGARRAGGLCQGGSDD